jgi:hypothetical protein
VQELLDKFQKSNLEKLRTPFDQHNFEEYLEESPLVDEMLKYEKPRLDKLKATKNHPKGLKLTDIETR